ETTADLAHTMVLPAAVRYQNELLKNAARAGEAGLEPEGVKSTLSQLNALINDLVTALRALDKQNAELGGDDVHSKAHHMRDNIIPAMTNVRAVVDKLERLVPDDLWPLPRYRDMLFIK